MVCYVKQHFATPSYPCPPSPEAIPLPLLADPVGIYFPFSETHGRVASSRFVTLVITPWLPPVLCGR